MELVKEVLFQTYQLLASTRLPGFNISVLQFFLGINAVILSIGFGKMFLGIGSDAVGIGVRLGKQKGGNNKNIKISEKRKKDTK